MKIRNFKIEENSAILGAALEDGALGAAGEKDLLAARLLPLLVGGGRVVRLSQGLCQCVSEVAGQGGRRRGGVP